MGSDVNADNVPLLADLKNLAGLGTGSNAKRDLLKLLSGHGFQATEFRLPLRFAGEKKKTIGFFKQPFLLPHLFLSTVFSLYTDAFDALVGAPGTLASFWESQAGNPNLRGHPMLTRVNWQEKAIPIILHGDAVPVTGVGKSWSKSSLVISWTSLLAKGSTIHCYNLIIAIMNTMFIKADNCNTVRAIWKIIAWSLKYSFSGMHPDTDMWGASWVAGSPESLSAGTDLAGVFFLVLWAVRGDLDFFSKD